MEPLGGEVQRELRRFGPQGGMAELVAAWPAAVGPEIARNAWPARIARDGTVHAHTADSIWAFELEQRAPEIAGRLGVPRLRFAAGALPEAGEIDAEAHAPTRVEPSRRDEELAAAIVAGVEHEGLRAWIARAAALSLARSPSDRSI